MCIICFRSFNEIPFNYQLKEKFNTQKALTSLLVPLIIHIQILIFAPYLHQIAHKLWYDRGVLTFWVLSKSDLSIVNLAKSHSINIFIYWKWIVKNFHGLNFFWFTSFCIHLFCFKWLFIIFWYVILLNNLVLISSFFIRCIMAAWLIQSIT